MLFTFDVDYTQLYSHLLRAGLYLPAVIGVWIFVYAFNAWAFQIIVNSGTHSKHLSFRHAYKLTVSGFAFSYTTPFGFGGGPYRVMELSSYIGVPRAMSSVVLYSMMHILSHICLWSSAAVLFAIVYTEKMTTFLWTLFMIFTVVLVVVLFVFHLCYKKGVIVKLFTPLLHLPFAKKWARKFYDKHADDMQKVDDNIAYLHSQPRAFYQSLLFEYVARVINALEYYFILLSLGVNLSLGCHFSIGFLFSDRQSALFPPHAVRSTRGRSLSHCQNSRTYSPRYRYHYQPLHTCARTRLDIHRC